MSTRRTPLKNVTLNQSPCSTPVTEQSRDGKRLRLSSSNKKIRSTGGIENRTGTKSPTSLSSLQKNDPEQSLEGIDYPRDVSFPNRNILKKFYERCLENEQLEVNKQLEDGRNDHIARYDQLYLNTAEILSFEKVLLPAIACLEDDTLKKLQSKVMRDLSTLKPVVIQCRKFVYSSVAAAISAAEHSRLERTKANLQREEQWALEKREKILEEERKREEDLAKIAAEQHKLKELHRLKKQREYKKKLPQNQEIWKEVAFLMSELTKLQNDEETWNQALTDTDQWEREITSQEMALVEEDEKQKIEQQDSLTQKESSITDQQAVERTEISDITQCIRDMTLSISQIEQGLQIVGNVVLDSESTRKELYEEFTQHHQFHGYQGINNSKGLLLALSASQDD